MFPLVRELADDPETDVDVAVACRVLGVSRSGYYGWLTRPASARTQENELLLKYIDKIHDDSRRTYGSPRVHAELRLEYGLSINLKRVARLMREAGIQGLYRRRHRGCTVRDPAADPFPDLVNRDFTADAPNRLWLTDIERIDALGMAIIRRRPDNQSEDKRTVTHSDHGSQYQCHSVKGVRCGRASV